MISNMGSFTLHYNSFYITLFNLKTENKSETLGQTRIHKN